MKLISFFMFTLSLQRKHKGYLAEYFNTSQKNVDTVSGFNRSETVVLKLMEKLLNRGRILCVCRLLPRWASQDHPVTAQPAEHWTDLGGRLDKSKSGNSPTFCC